MKDKKTTILIVVIVLLLIGLSYAKSVAPKPADWKPTFVNTKTDPYGTYITYQLLEDIFAKENIRTTRIPVYNNLKNLNSAYLNYEENETEYYEDISTSDVYTPIDSLEYADEDEADIDSLQTDQNTSDWFQKLDNISDTTSYIFVNTRFTIDKLDLEYLLDFVGLGNNAFISSEAFDSRLLDTLKIRTNAKYYENDTIHVLKEYPQREYNIGNIYGLVSLNTDSCPHPTRILGTNNKKATTFVDIKFGKGHIYLHTVPTAFTNVYMLQTRKYDYGFRSLSYLPANSKIIWDEYQKQGISIANEGTFRAMLSNESLRTALYIILAALLLFVIFRAKRTQRVIPVIQAPVNSSLEFLGTISNLYYRKKDFTTIAEKRHAYFLDFIRKNYYMTTENIGEDFINILSAKSNTDRDKLNELFSLHKDLILLPYASNEMFLKYNSLLEEFYKNAKNK